MKKIIGLTACIMILCALNVFAEDEMYITHNGGIGKDFIGGEIRYTNGSGSYKNVVGVLALYDHGGSVLAADFKVKGAEDGETIVLTPLLNYTACAYGRTMLWYGDGIDSMKPVGKSAVISEDGLEILRGYENMDDMSNFYINYLNIISKTAVEHTDANTGENDRGGQYADDPVSAIQQTAAGARILMLAYNEPTNHYYSNSDIAELAAKSLDFVFSQVQRGESNKNGIPYCSFSNPNDGGDSNLDRFILVPLLEVYNMLREKVESGRLENWNSELEDLVNYQYRNYGLEILPSEVPLKTNYPNVDQLYCALMAQWGSFSNNQIYLTEAKTVFESMFDHIGENGGFLYIAGTNPVPLYQKHVIFLHYYYKYTNDQRVFDMFEQLGEYFPQAYGKVGIAEYGTSPELKQSVISELGTPSGPEIVAFYQKDRNPELAAKNAMSANILKKQYTIKRQYGNSGMMANDHVLVAIDAISNVEPKKFDYSKVFYFQETEGLKGIWDDFLATTTTKKASNTQIQLMLEDYSNNNINSALNWVYFESRRTKTDTRLDYPSTWSWLMPATEIDKYNTAKQDNVVKQIVKADDKVAIQYTKYRPVSYFRYTQIPTTTMGDFIARQHWIITRDRVAGSHSMELADNAQGAEMGAFARSRIIFGSTNVGTLTTTLQDNLLTGRYNNMGFYLEMLPQCMEHWEFRTDLQNSQEPTGTVPTGINYRHDQQIAVSKKPTGDNVVWNTSKKDEAYMAYNAVFYPIRNKLASWQGETQNISFTNSGKIRVAIVKMLDGSGDVYLTASNQGESQESQNIQVPLAPGNYTMDKFVDQLGVATESMDIVSQGEYGLNLSLAGDSAIIYRFTAK